MATYQQIDTVSVQAGSAISIHRFVELNSDGKFDHCDGAQGDAHGVSAEAASAEDDTFAMALLKGIMKVEAGAAITRGDIIATDTVGRAITHTSGAGNMKLGQAMEAASAAGEVIEVLLLPREDGST